MGLEGESQGHGQPEQGSAALGSLSAPAVSCHHVVPKMPETPVKNTHPSM